MEDQNVKTDTERREPDVPPPSAGSSGWNPLDDEFEEILGGSWAVIRTADGWEIECQHSQTTLPLKSTDMESAKIEGRKLAMEFERRYLTNSPVLASEPREDCE